MSITREWDWEKNKSNYWLIPSIDSAYLAENWSFKGYSKFLDLGCGLGRHSIYMASHGFSVSAVDLSEYGINYLNKWSNEEGLTIDTHISNMLSLPFQDNSFQCIIAYNVIYHTDTKGFKEVLKEIRRVLKPGGEVYMTLLSKNTWGYNKANEKNKLDENTVLLNHDETEENVPHFYVNLQDIKKLFSEWKFVMSPIEYCEYNMEKPEFYSTHWKLIIK